MRTLDLSLDPPTEDMGGLDSTDFEQMRTLSRIKHLRVRVGKGVRLPKICGTRTYIEHLASLDHDWEGGICQLSIYSQIPQPINHCLQLANQFTNLQLLALDNVLDITADLAAVSMPNLQSFKLRNPVNLKFDSLSGFSFLLDCSRLKSLAILGCQFDSAFLRDVLVACKDQLVCLELGTTGREACLDRTTLAKARRAGEHSLETGWHIPLSLLDEPERIGDMAARVCTKLNSLSLGGLLCLSPELLNILRDESRPKLHVLSLHAAGPQRPTRPSDDSQAREEQAVLAKRPAGISPQELSDALISGLTVRRLELRGMGSEWDFRIHEPAQAVKDKCSELGIELIWRIV